MNDAVHQRRIGAQHVVTEDAEILFGREVFRHAVEVI